MSQAILTFFGGVAAMSHEEEILAYEMGREAALSGFTLRHGGYNGLMEHAARGAAQEGGKVVAVTLAGKEAWGKFNPYVHEAIYAPDLGTRLSYLLESADIAVGMGGGVGSLHELTAAIWYAGNIRRIPVLITGRTACRLLSFLRRERWLYESPTRDLSFLHTAETVGEIRTALASALDQVSTDRAEAGRSIAERVMRTASVRGDYQLADGEVITDYFDPFRLAADPALSAELAREMARLLPAPPDAIAGVALGGVVLAAMLARELGRPLLIARAEPKGHGTFAQVEGLVKDAQRVLLVDDVVRTGQQTLQAVHSLRRVGLQVTEVICVLSRPGPGRALLNRHDVTLRAVLRDSGADDAPAGYEPARQG